MAHRSTKVWSASTISSSASTLLPTLSASHGNCEESETQKGGNCSLLSHFCRHFMLPRMYFQTPSSHQPPPPTTVFTRPTPIISHHWFQVSPSLEAFTDSQRQTGNSPSYIPLKDLSVLSVKSHALSPLTFSPGGPQEDGEGV